MRKSRFTDELMVRIPQSRINTCRRLVRHGVHGDAAANGLVIDAPGAARAFPARS